MMAPMATSLKAVNASSLIKPAASLLVNAITGGVMRALKRKEGGILPLLALPLIIEVLQKIVASWKKKDVRTAGKGYNNMDHINKKF